MFTVAEKRAASKLYALLYNGSNIYNTTDKRKRGDTCYYTIGDPVDRYCLIVRELKQFMKDIECE